MTPEQQNPSRDNALLMETLTLAESENLRLRAELAEARAGMTTLSDRLASQPDNELRDRVLAALASHEPWDLPHILDKLCEAAGILLDEKNYDRDGNEEIRHCQLMGQKLSPLIRELLSSL